MHDRLGATRMDIGFICTAWGTKIEEGEDHTLNRSGSNILLWF